MALLMLKAGEPGGAVAGARLVGSRRTVGAIDGGTMLCGAGGMTVAGAKHVGAGATVGAAASVGLGT